MITKETKPNKPFKSRLSSFKDADEIKLNN